jgi:hypothetical protein
MGDSLAGEAADIVEFTSTEVRGGGPPDNKRKRRALNNDDYNKDDIHDEDSDEEGGGACLDPNTSRARKKAKLEQLACPFRKQNPLRHNCREWEYCSKAPFRSMSELKQVSTPQPSTPHFLTTWFTENTSSSTTANRNLPSSAPDATRPFPGTLRLTGTSGRRTDRSAR